ncbi:hypothetical protein A4A49_34543, partial [Nicotiana attenuata]
TQETRRRNIRKRLNEVKHNHPFAGLHQRMSVSSAYLQIFFCGSMKKLKTITISGKHFGCSTECPNITHNIIEGLILYQGQGLYGSTLRPVEVLSQNLYLELGRIFSVVKLHSQS